MKSGETDISSTTATMEERRSAIKASNEADEVLLSRKKDLAAKALNEYKSTLKDTTAKTVDKARASLKLRHANNQVALHEKRNSDACVTADALRLACELGHRQFMNGEVAECDTPFSNVGYDDTWGDKNDEGGEGSNGAAGEDGHSTLDNPMPQSEKSKKHALQAKPTQTRNRRRIRRNGTKSMKIVGGSKLFRSKYGEKSNRKNNRLCLLNSILRVMPDGLDGITVRTDVASSMPKEGDTPISSASKALMPHGIYLHPISKKYHQLGGPEFNLLQEKDCRLIINVKLTNVKKQHMYHFVAWDGKVVHDDPQSVSVEALDRATSKTCRAVFDKLYKKDEFHSWQICSVYEMTKVV
jgi:hypothetical protein